MSSTPHPSAITYIGLPVSSGGSHHLGRMSRRVAYDRTMSFLGACTEPVAALEYSLQLMDVPELGPFPSLEKAMERRFGQGIAPFSPSRQSIPIQVGRVDDVLDFLDEIEPQPTNRWRMAPIWFFVGAKFRILDPVTGRALPGQDPVRYGGAEYEWRVPLGSSGLRLILTNRASISIELCIPDADDALLHQVVPWLEQHLPFRFSPQHWRAWVPTKTGSFRARRFHPQRRVTFGVAE